MMIEDFYRIQSGSRRDANDISPGTESGYDSCDVSAVSIIIPGRSSVGRKAVCGTAEVRVCQVQASIKHSHTHSLASVSQHPRSCADALHARWNNLAR